MSTGAAESLRDQLIAVVRQDTEFADAIDDECTEAEYVVDHIFDFLLESGRRIVRADENHLTDELRAAVTHLRADHLLTISAIGYALRDTTTDDLAVIGAALAESAS